MPTAPGGVRHRFSTNTCTPLRPLAFERELESHPDKAWVKQLVQELQHGFHTGYEGDRFPLTAGNLRSAHEHDEVVDEALQKELSAGRIEGPFNSPPFANFRCSGLGVVPKQDGSWRIIYHLSAPAGLSVNDGIDPERYTLKYCTVDSAIYILNQLGPGTLMAKIDLKHAFRNCPVHPSDWELLGIHWKNRYYFDKCLPFGLRSAPYLFNKVADAMEWILRYRYNIP